MRARSVRVAPIENALFPETKETRETLKNLNPVAELRIMTLDLTNLTKADVYAAAQDLAMRLERQIALTEALRSENTALASRPCFSCDMIVPERIRALTERVTLLEAELRGALCMLDLVKAEPGSLYLGTVEEFTRDRNELNENFKRLTK